MNRTTDDPTGRPPTPTGGVVVPIETAAELRGRIRLALALFDHRGHTADTARLADRALRGDSIAHLAAGDTAGRRTTKGA